MSVIIVGAGICGLGTALLLARDGHDVTILERDPDPLPESPDDAWEHWSRKGVAQFRQPHNFMPGLRLLLEAELPDIQDALAKSGASRYDLINPLPPFVTDRSPRPIDEKLWTWTARRPLGEWIFANATNNEPRVTVRRGFKVTELIAGASVIPGTPHVVGVRGTDGEELRADLVVDATGRQSRGAEWLTAIGAQAPIEEQADSGFTYYTRYFSGKEPVRMAPGLSALGTISLLTLPGDNGTWSVTVFTSTGDQPLKQLRHEEQWTRTVRACPLHAHWLDGEAITDVLPMSGVVDRYRRFVVDDQPVATGLVAVADAWACTNPSAGRGLTVGFLHAAQLRDVVRHTLDKPRALVEQFDAKTEEQITPWYDAQIAADRARFAQMDALREGRHPPPPADALGRKMGLFFSTITADPDLFRDALEYIGTVTPIQRILERHEVTKRVQAARERMKDSPPMAVPGPNRQQLLELMK
jgi:2-polyprenyl-6-methoxyphenol hydroxylase-like FAD-dependent oxidoreductase